MMMSGGVDMDECSTMVGGGWRILKIIVNWVKAQVSSLKKKKSHIRKQVWGGDVTMVDRRRRAPWILVGLTFLDDSTSTQHKLQGTNRHLPSQ